MGDLVAYGENQEVGCVGRLVWGGGDVAGLMWYRSGCASFGLIIVWTLL